MLMKIYVRLGLHIRFIYFEGIIGHRSTHQFISEFYISALLEIELSLKIVYNKL